MKEQVCIIKKIKINVYNIYKLKLLLINLIVIEY